MERGREDGKGGGGGRGWAVLARINGRGLHNQQHLRSTPGVISMLRERDLGAPGV